MFAADASTVIPSASGGNDEAGPSTSTAGASGHDETGALASGSKSWQETYEQKVQTKAPFFRWWWTSYFTYIIFSLCFIRLTALF